MNTSEPENISTSVRLADIEHHTIRYAEAREQLMALVAAIEAEMEALKRARLPAIRRALQKAATLEAALRERISAAPELFVKPRSVVMHGIKVGWQKGRGGIVWDDADAVVAAIQKHLPEQAEALIRWTAKPLKEAINQLDVATLKKLGCRVVDTGDEVLIKPVDGAVDKLVSALLAGAAEAAQAGE